MSSNYYRRGRNPTTAFGILFIVIGAIALFRQLFAWSPDFFLQFLFACGFVHAAIPKKLSRQKKVRLMSKKNFISWINM